jgi:hypothetical protein
VKALLLGPELYWALVYAASHLFAARNYPPTPEGNAMLETMWWLFPLIAVPLSYAIYLAQNAASWWLLLRINIASIVGLTLCLHTITSAIDYHDGRNAGVFAGFALGLGLGLLVLAVCDVVAAIRLMFRRRAIP